jgi:DNA repair protein RadA/Sms
VFAGIEGTRPVLVEIQSLTAPSALGTPRRAVVGWDTGRLAMILAVLESRSSLALAGLDVYLNIVGGLKIGEPAADLAVAAALISSVSGVPVPPETVVFGEIGLSGEVRAVSRVDARLKEAAKLGFSRAIIPGQSRAQGNNRGNNKKTPERTMEITEISRLEDLLVLFAKPDSQRAGQRAGPPVAAANTRGRGHG